MIKKGDFVELEYTGTDVESGEVFDTTNKEEGKHLNQKEFRPVVICVGEGHVLKGLDAFLEGKETGKEYEVTLSPEDAFGKKDAKLLKLIPLKTFTKEKIKPYPGLQVNIDNNFGVVKSVGSGRVIVDFNNPLSGHYVKYNLRAIRKVEDKAEQVKALFKIKLGMDVETSAEGEKIEVKAELPEEIKNFMNEEIKKLVKAEVSYKK